MLDLLEACLSVCVVLVRQPKANRLSPHRQHYHLTPMGCFVGIGCRGGGIHGVYSRMWSSLGVDGGVLMRLIIIIGVTDDNDFAVAGRPEDATVEVPKSFLASSLSREVSATESSSREDEARSTTGIGSEGPACSHGGKQRWRDEVSGGDCVGEGDPEWDGGGVEALLGEENPRRRGNEDA
jgi:hypothetical protein